MRNACQVAGKKAPVQDSEQSDRTQEER